jgi:hypothetical protein
MELLTRSRKCKLCNNSLKLIGIHRINGKINQCDWASREYHKSCFKTIKLREEISEKVGKVYGIKNSLENLYLKN